MPAFEMCSGEFQDNFYIMARWFRLRFNRMHSAKRWSLFKSHFLPLEIYPGLWIENIKQKTYAYQPDVIISNASILRNGKFLQVCLFVKLNVSFKCLFIHYVVTFFADLNISWHLNVVVNWSWKLLFFRTCFLTVNSLWSYFSA